MIDVRTAVNAATNYLLSIQDIMGDLQDMRLEEIEPSEDKRYWLITLGFDIPAKAQSTLEMFNYSRKYERKYKLFKVNSETGEVEAMKIREV